MTLGALSMNITRSRASTKYQRSKGFDVTNDLFADKSFYFRNALVRANYENQKLNVDKTRLPLEEFFKVLLYGDEIELHNRFLKIGQEYGTSAAKAIADLHRHDDVVNDVINKPDVGINVGIKCHDDGVNDGVNLRHDGVKYTLTESEEKAVKAILRDSHITAIVLSGMLSVKKRQAERIIASLKKKAGLKRRGADKNGEWYFETF